MQLNKDFIIGENDIPQIAKVAGIPVDIIRDITREKLAVWLADNNLTKCVRVEVAGYGLIRSIDGGVIKEREVTLVDIRRDGVYEPHYHAHSDALFIVIDGCAVLLGSQDEKIIRSGDLIAIPRKTLHGFKLHTDQSLTWVSVQHPPIHSSDGEEDLHFPANLKASL